MTNKSFLSIREMTLCAMFVALMTIGGQIKLDFTGVPFTLQTLIVMLAGSLLGKRLGTVSMFVFIALVAVGAPLLAGFKGGIGTLFGPTGGYIWCFPLSTYLIGFMIEKLKRGQKPKYWHVLGAYLLGGIVVVHLIGYIWFCSYMNVPYGKNLVLGLLVFIPGDVIKALVGTVISLGVYNAIPSLIPSNGKQNKVLS
ncbi:biotin transport system substrate-specific component [Thermoactinomyces sp. DSM 45891]|uniref:biotin transporter BioY n=1 Tax=Thermoactinomyces sp. DSM 45891 TaxID=1761907 RepID=UPI00092257BC|nr:biotin transporter BioY [Thermoactinomyces sp. DSM 45891]SFX44177.1 biotin transport system substrate-specific component [Thermoactinomyces sp. DSM 45891]